MKFCWTTLQVKNMEKSLKFYEEIVGLPLKRKYSPSEGMEIAFLGDGETEVELIDTDATETIDLGHDISMGFMTESVDDLIKSLNEKGYPIYSGPFKPNPTIKFFYVLDPNGLKIQFVEKVVHSL